MFADGRPGVQWRNPRSGNYRGVVDVSEVVRPLGALPGQDCMKAIILNFDSLRDDLHRLGFEGRAVPISEAKLQAPLPRPSKILAMGGNYREFGARQPSPMWGFTKSPDAIIGPGATVVLPPIDANIFHHEAELVVVFGRAGKDVKRAEAMDYVFGYTCGVDVSARMPTATGGSGGGGGARAATFLPISIPKSHPTFAPIGPCIVTKDEIADPHNLSVRLWVNGELRPDYSTSDLAHSIPESIEWASSKEAFDAGDILFMGTNHQGLGAMQDGDHIEMEIEGIGRFAFDVTDPLKRRWARGVDELTAQGVREGNGSPGSRVRPL
jgi:2-keto-4-pentenoate hydratase/2-oxohepta-3-ene-1,7-dioic acid hydratase in catechol pathway